MTHRPARPPLRIDSPGRRRLLKAFAASGLLGIVERAHALAKDAADYRALVCIYMQGGNDGENTVVRLDPAGYANYAATRPPASGINIAQKDLLPIQPRSVTTPLGLHPALGPLKALFERQRLAIVANVGMLVQPSTKPGLDTGGAPRPANLFSHPDQDLAMQSADHRGFNRIGWGGRMADKLEVADPGNLFPAMISTSGLHTFVSGATTVPLTVPDNPYFRLFGSGDNHYQFDVLRDAALRELLAQPRTNLYDAVAQLYAEEGFASSSVVFPILQNAASLVTPFFASLDTQVGRQLRTIAQLIEGREQIKLRRQVFYVHQGGYDTHGGQAATQQRLFGELAPALEAFDAAMTALGVSGAVTTFTMSEFGRTFKPAASAGTDHGWGNYAFVLGGAVKGGDVYGKLPTLALGGPDDLGKEGRWIPTTSLEQYGSTMARWIGIGDGDLPYVFPNLAAFGGSGLALF